MRRIGKTNSESLQGQPRLKKISAALKQAFKKPSHQFCGAGLLAMSIAASPVTAQDFPAEFELAGLNGSNGFVLTGSSEFESSGREVNSAGDINGDGLDDMLISGRDHAYTYFITEVGRSKFYVVFGRDDSFPAEVSLSDIESGDGSDGFVIYDAQNHIQLNPNDSNSISKAGDVNGDGIDDIVIGARAGFDTLDDPVGPGKSYIVFGRDTGFPAQFQLSSLASGNGTQGVVLNGINSGDFSGSSVSGAGDINGDGTDDIVIGAPGASPSGRDEAGESYVVYGRSSWPATIALSSIKNGNGSTGFSVLGAFADDNVGTVVSRGGDLNNDGFDDVVFGAFRGDFDPVTEEGPAYILFGLNTGFPGQLDLIQLETATTPFLGVRLTGIAAESDQFIAPAGDVNSDGIDDLIIGANLAAVGGQSSVGESYVVFGRELFPVETVLTDLAFGNGSTGFIIRGEEGNDRSGQSVSSAGDINGDGVDDVLIGAPSSDEGGQTDVGRSYVVYGRFDGFPSVVNLSSLSGANGFALNGVDSFNGTGYSVSAAGDVNGDDLDDLFVGAPRTMLGSTPRAGESYVVFGRAIDSDGDGLNNTMDNCIFVANPDQRDTNDDGFGNICDPDVTNDGIVNFADIGFWAPFFGTTNSGDVDFNGDGSVNFLDFTILVEFFLGPPGPSGQVPED